MNFEWKCPYCGGSFDGNGDCPNYCESDYCGICQATVDKEHTHIKKGTAK